MGAENIQGIKSPASRSKEAISSRELSLKEVGAEIKGLSLQEAIKAVEAKLAILDVPGKHVNQAEYHQILDLRELKRLLTEGAKILQEIQAAGVVNKAVMQIACATLGMKPKILDDIAANDDRFAVAA